jgi:type I restriction-modification system DNA methylase subunit
MSKYDGLDARSGLEQEVAQDLRAALEKRGFTVIHNGTASSHAPSGVPDIVVGDGQVLTFEVTKSSGAAQDREINSIRDHLYQVQSDNPYKHHFCVFVSPETSSRMFDAIRDHNQQRAAEGIADLKILPLCFDTLELWLTRLTESEADLYPVVEFIRVFQHHTEFIDDVRIRKHLVGVLFAADGELVESVGREETERDQKTLESLIQDLARMEDYMRENGIAVGHAAIDTLIYLVFLKIYEEKRQRDGATNRLRSRRAFQAYRRDSVSEETRSRRRAIHNLFDDIKREGEFLSSEMFSEGDNLVDSVDDNFILEYVIPILAKYNFLGTRIDALGAVYEVLALRAEKDVKVGQFFTPENVVRFMVKLARLEYRDLVLDPACGTGRFLIHAMSEMLDKVARSDARDKADEQEQVRLHRLFGADIDPRIAKIAKMNMWVHGDGKANIFGGPGYNGLTLHRHGFQGHVSFDNAFDVVLTNPPLGDVNYATIEFVVDAEDDQEVIANTLKRMPVLPHRNITEERLRTVRERLGEYLPQLAEVQGNKQSAEQTGVVQEWLLLPRRGGTTEQQAQRRALEQTDYVQNYKSVCSAWRQKERTVERNESLEAELRAKVRDGDVEWAISGNKMKGGAQFLAAIWHYLKDTAYPNDVAEWRGGRVLIVLDEGILNTDNYRGVREFLRTHFYVKAVISLTRDAFVPISNTANKTSILFAVKKTDLAALQREPVFFAHVDKVGLTRVGKVCADHLPLVLDKYFEFSSAVLRSYRLAEFSRDRFRAECVDTGQVVDSVVEAFDPDFTGHFFKSGEEARTIFFWEWPEQVLTRDRMHYLFYHPKHTALQAYAERCETVELADICREPITRGDQPEYDEFGDVTVLKTVDLKNDHIEHGEALKVSREFYEAHPNAQVRRNDILVASTGYVSMGKIDVYDRDDPAMVDGHVSIVRVNEFYDPHFVVYYLRSNLGQLQFEKWFTGSSGQIELQPSDLGKFMVPAATETGVPFVDQGRIAQLTTDALQDARDLERDALSRRAEARAMFERTLTALAERPETGSAR